MRRATAATAWMGLTTTCRMTTASTPPAATIVSSAIRICRLRWARTAANTGSMVVPTRTTARTLWSLPWHH